MERFIIQEFEKSNFYVVTDQIHGIVIVFEKGKYNNLTLDISIIERIVKKRPKKTPEYKEIKKEIREMEDWLYLNHKDKM
ncbi:hypothetical protein [Flavobacterium tructae]|uniref:hypothetical protein n=1 Tax=Flavobacterium tructae TaxID=1114873 RepID=UPI0035A89A49